jgi:hypothetical protein
MPSKTDAIDAFTAELDFQAFRADRKTVYAAVRALEIVSEASRQLPGDLLKRHPRPIGRLSPPPEASRGVSSLASRGATDR